MLEGKSMPSNMTANTNHITLLKSQSAIKYLPYMSFLSNFAEVRLLLWALSIFGISKILTHCLMEVLVTWPFSARGLYRAQVFRDNWNCYALSLFREFLLASSGNSKHILMRQKVWDALACYFASSSTRPPERWVGEDPGNNIVGCGRGALRGPLEPYKIQVLFQLLINCQRAAW